MAKVLDYSFEVSEFEFQSHYYIHSRTNTLQKGMNPSYPPSYMLSSITAVLL